MAEQKINGIIEDLWKNPGPKNWNRFAAALGKSNIKYYKVFYEKGSKLRNVDDLKDSYIQLYGSDQKAVNKLPLFKKEGKKIRGATIYLKGLFNLNK